MKTITYNEQTHVLVPREPTRDMVIAGTHQRFRDSYDAEEDCYRAMLAAAPQPEPVDGKPVEYLLDGARFKLSFQEIECDECGTESPYVLVTPLDQYANELNGKWVALVPAENDRHLHIAAQPDRTAELEAALKVARDGIGKFLVANDPTEFGCACDLSVGYLCGPCHADMQQERLKIALAKINEVLKP